MSIYRPLARSARSDVHHVAEHVVGPESREPHSNLPPGETWSSRRKAAPPDFLFATTERWMASLPLEVQPRALARRFPRLANALAALWARPVEAADYLNDLLVDRRGGRQGFPLEVLDELHTLNAYYAALQPRRAAP
jgi:hypothetical protein